jgi:hypothetical protein
MTRALAALADIACAARIGMERSAAACALADIFRAAGALALSAPGNFAAANDVAVRATKPGGHATA